MIDSYFIKPAEKRKCSTAAFEPMSKRDKEEEGVVEGESSGTSRGSPTRRPQINAQCSQMSFLQHGDRKLSWKKISVEDLDVDYVQLFTKREADILFQEAEKVIQYDKTSQLFIHGKWVNIPRKQTAFGQDGLKYGFSGSTVFAKPWSDAPFLKDICDLIISLTGKPFNFVLVNRYKDGNDHIGEHRDDEVILAPGTPIASLSLGQVRDFVFRHRDARGSAAKRTIEPIKLSLAHGSLLMMNYPTNVYWYHSLPVRRKALGARINLTFRQMVTMQ